MRMSCHSATANQVRLVLHTAAFWLMHGVRAAIPRTSPLAGAEFATIRERLIKIGARVIEHIARIRVHCQPVARKRHCSEPSHSACSNPARELRGVAPQTSRRLRQINSNALHSEWHHTDPAGRTASTRSLNRPKKCATSCIIAANYLTDNFQHLAVLVRLAVTGPPRNSL
jgi:hypothetical protein